MPKRKSTTGTMVEKNEREIFLKEELAILGWRQSLLKRD